MSDKPGVELKKLFVTLETRDESKLEVHCRAEFLAIVERAKAGSVLTHDGIAVSFFADRFEHAFRTSSDWCASRFAKDKLDVERLIRVCWIEPVIGGLVPRSACWSIRDTERTELINRMYLVWDENYVVWLEPTKSGGWRFSSAYRARDSLIGKYTSNGKEIWRRES